MRKLTAIILAAAILTAACAAHAAVITKVDAGKPIDGEIVSMTPDELRISSAGVAVNIKTIDLVSVVMRPPKRIDGTHSVQLRNGDVIAGVVVGSPEPKAEQPAKPADDSVLVRSASLGDLAIRMSDIDSLLFESDQPPPQQAAARDKDEVILRNGDSLAGVLVSFGKEMLTFDCPLGKVGVPFSRIRSVRFAALGAQYKEPDTLLFAVTCADTSTLTGIDARWTGREFSVQSTLGTAFKLPADQVSAIEIRNGRIVYLSDMQPAEVKETPMFDERPWGWQRDRSVSGKPISLGGRIYRKGLGVHSRCELSYDLGGTFKKFMAEVGINDAVDGGNVEIRVYADGRQVFPPNGKQLVSKKSGPLPIEIDVTGAAKLTLVVDFGEELHVNDHADWADARLLR